VNNTVQIHCPFKKKKKKHKKREEIEERKKEKKNIALESKEIIFKLA
jgi:hypothetical protein